MVSNEGEGVRGEQVTWGGRATRIAVVREAKVTATASGEGVRGGKVSDEARCRPQSEGDGVQGRTYDSEDEGERVGEGEGGGGQTATARACKDRARVNELGRASDDGVRGRRRG
jgi:hypothetical protein